MPAFDEHVRGDCNPGVGRAHHCRIVARTQQDTGGLTATRDDASALDAPAQTGFDHLSLTAVGLADAKTRLQAHGVPFDQVPVPGADIMQLFLRDPLGVRIELTFLGER